MNRIGVLLMNLGSPDSTDVADVRRYLREFLMDERVIDIPFPQRWLLVNGIIAPFRAPKSAEAYKSVWTKEGSPLVAITKRVQAALKDELPVPVEIAMRYQNPTVESAVEKLSLLGVNHIVLVPMFPHYAMSSYETAVEKVKAAVPGHIELTVVPPYFEDPDYIAALTASVRPYLGAGFDHVLVSFHGVPERHIRKADPTGTCLTAGCCDKPKPTCYRSQCFRTARLLASRCGLTDDQYTVAFQSRLGRDKWLEPATDQELIGLARSGIRRLIVVCPAFVADCLETIEEIGMRGREQFLEAGGESYTVVPCLNDHPQWISALRNIVQRASANHVVSEIAAAPLDRR